MKTRSDEESYGILHNNGFTVLEISRLIKLHRDYIGGKFDQDSLVYTSCDTRSEKTCIIKKFFALLWFNDRSGLVHSAV
jgi:hypothetical protein